MHDFRMVTGPSHTNLIFDVVVPYNCPLSPDEVEKNPLRKDTEAAWKLLWSDLYRSGLRHKIVIKRTALMNLYQKTGIP